MKAKVLMTMIMAGGAILTLPAVEKPGEKESTAEAKTAAKAAETKAGDTAKRTAKTAGESKPADAGRKADAKKPTVSAEVAQAAKTHAAREAAKLTETQQNRLLEILNKGEDAALEAIPGIGEARAKGIKKARPLKKVEDLMAIEGIGESTYDETIKWAKSGMKGGAEVPAAKTKKPAEPAKPAPKPETAKKK